MAQKKTHFGRAGEFHAMSELLLRGWNVAVPVVDVGDDVFVIDDNDKTTYRLQVKSAEAEPIPGAAGQPGPKSRGRFLLSRLQLRSQQPVELFYILLIRLESRWRMLVVPRIVLFDAREAFVALERTGRGRRPVADADATTDALNLTVELSEDDATLWGVSLGPYLDKWPEALAVIDGGPGTVQGEPPPTPTS